MEREQSIGHIYAVVRENRPDILLFSWILDARETKHVSSSSNFLQADIDFKKFSGLRKQTRYRRGHVQFGSLREHTFFSSLYDLNKRVAEGCGGFGER